MSELDRLFKNMAEVVGKDYVLTDKPTSLVYAKDVMPYDVEGHNMPYAVVRPGNSKEISDILKLANSERMPVHIHGSGTSLIGAGRPKAKGLVLDTGRMDSLTVFPERGYFEAGPGLHVAKASKGLAKYRALLPIFPGSELVATVGGAIAVNTSSHGVDAALGKPGDFVLGLEIVLPTGEIIEVGTESTRKPAGIDLTKFFIGSEGVLCVITLVRMRLIPSPYFENLVAHFANSDEIMDLVMEMYRRNIPPPLFFEFLDENAAKVGFEAVGLAPPKAAVAIMSVHSDTRTGCQEKAQNFLAFVNERKPLSAKAVQDSDEWRKIWSSRAEAGNYISRLGSSFGSEISPRIDRLKEAYHEARAIILNLESYKNPQFFSFGHIGAPSIHASAFFPTKEIPNDVKKALVKEVREKTEGLNVKYRGCGGEWGLTSQRVSFLKSRYGTEYYELLIKLKKTLDPNNILNRGNLEGWV